MTALAFDERFVLLVEAEWLARENKRLARALHEAKLKLSEACIEAIVTEAMKWLADPGFGQAPKTVQIEGSVTTGFKMVFRKWAPGTDPASLPMARDAQTDRQLEAAARALAIQVHALNRRGAPTS